MSLAGDHFRLVGVHSPPQVSGEGDRPECGATKPLNAHRRDRFVTDTPRDMPDCPGCPWQGATGATHPSPAVGDRGGPGRRGEPGGRRETDHHRSAARAAVSRGARRAHRVRGDDHLRPGGAARGDDAAATAPRHLRQGGHRHHARLRPGLDLRAQGRPRRRLDGRLPQPCGEGGGAGVRGLGDRAWSRRDAGGQRAPTRHHVHRLGRRDVARLRSGPWLDGVEGLLLPAGVG